MNRTLRVALIVGLLGAAAGALVGVLWYFGVALVALRGQVPSGRDAVWVISMGALGGAVAGFVLGPLVGFLLLRHVALGRAIAFTGAGTLAGLAASIAMNGRHPIPLTLGGFLVGAAAARLGARRAPASERRDREPTGGPR